MAIHRGEPCLAPAAGVRWRQVSESGGTQPRWNRNGHELFFIAANGPLMSSQFTSTAGRTPGSRVPHTSTPQMLFATMMTTAQGGLIRQQYAVAGDGNRFLLNAVAAEAATAPVTIISNWRGLGR
jgi:hypothetical protein